MNAEIDNVKIDFRAQAEAGTLAMLEQIDDMTDSGCVRVLKNQHGRYVFETVFLAISTICLLNSFLPLPLALFGVIPKAWIFPMLFGGLAVLLIMRKVKSLIIKAYLRKRAQSMVSQFSQLKSRAIAIEDGNTFKKVKILTEDEGFCLFEPDQHQLLIEGIMFRYIIFAKDVNSVEPISGYAMGGARLNCRLGGVDLDFVMNVAGQGPVTSLIETFNPKHNAVGLSTQINQTLFALTQESYKKPPSLPGQGDG
jgi:hypothetical protein